MFTETKIRLPKTRILIGPDDTFHGFCRIAKNQWKYFLNFLNEHPDPLGDEHIHLLNTQINKSPSIVIFKQYPTQDFGASTGLVINSANPEIEGLIVRPYNGLFFARRLEIDYQTSTIQQILARMRD